MKRSRKLLASVLALCILISCIPCASAADARVTMQPRQLPARYYYTSSDKLCYTDENTGRITVLDCHGNTLLTLNSGEEVEFFPTAAICVTGPPASPTSAAGQGQPRPDGDLPVARGGLPRAPEL